MKTDVFRMLALVVGLLFSAALRGEEEGEGRFEERFAEVVERLELSEPQVEPFREALRARRAERKEIVERHGVQPGAGKRANFKALRAAAPELKAAKRASDGRLAGILSEEQMREYEALRRELAKEAKKGLKARAYD